MRISIILLSLMILAACAEYPDGAEFTSEGIIFRSYKLKFPKVSLSSDTKKTFTFKNVGFNYRKDPFVSFVVVSKKRIPVSEIDNVISVEIWEIGDQDRLVFRQSSALNGALSPIDTVRDISWRTSFTPSDDDFVVDEEKFIGYVNRKKANLSADLSRFGEYRLVVENTNPSKNLGLEGYVQLSTTWK